MSSRGHTGVEIPVSSDRAEFRMSPMDEQCPVCLQKDVSSQLQLFQINMHEAIKLCALRECPYPAGSGKSVTDLMVRRNLSELSLKYKRLSRPVSPILQHTPQAVFPPVERKLRTTVELGRPLPAVSEPLSDPMTQGAVTQQNSPFTQTMDRSVLDLSAQPTPPHCDTSPTIVTKNLDSERGHIRDQPVPVGKPPTTGSENNSGQETSVRETMCVKEGLKKAAATLDGSTLPKYTKAHQPTPAPPALSDPVDQMGEPCYRDTFLQWTNRDALCWLDVSMHLLVHSHCFCKYIATRHRASFNKTLTLPKLTASYKSAQENTRQALQFRHYATLAQEGRLVTLQTSIGKIIVKTGGGSSAAGSKPLSPVIRNKSSEVSGGSREWVMTPTELNERASALLDKARKTLATVRDTLWVSLEPRLRCVLGKNDSPVFALPLMLREHRLFQDYFKMKYYWQMDCTECGYQHIDEQEKSLTSFPAVPPEFCMQRPHFLRSCFECEASGQRMTMVPQELPDVLMAHFVDGLQAQQLTDYDFSHQGSAWYAVKGVVRYTNHPDHFVAWLRDLETNHWMQCDDLANEICTFSSDPPTFPLKEVHMVMWEKLESSKAFSPSEGCVRLQRLSSQYTLPQRKPRFTTVKGLAETRPQTIAKINRPSLLSSAAGSRKREPGLCVTEVIEVLSSQTSSDSQEGGTPEDHMPKRAKRTSHHIGGINKSIASPPLASETGGVTVKGVSLGGKAALLVPGLKPLSEEEWPNAENPQAEGRQVGCKSSTGLGGNLKSTSSGASSLTELVNQNLRKILEEKRSGGIVPFGSEKGDSQSDRLQRLRDKLQMAKLQKAPGASVKANLTADFVQGHCAAKDASSKADAAKAAGAGKPVVGHLSVPRVDMVNGREVDTSSVRNYTVLHSPSQQRSAVKEMLRALQSRSSHQMGTNATQQSFAGYRPKVKAEMAQTQCKKSVPAGGRSSQRATKKISFGKEVQVLQTVSSSAPSADAMLNTVHHHDKALKRQGGHFYEQCPAATSPRPAAKKILVSSPSRAGSSMSRVNAGSKTGGRNVRGNTNLMKLTKHPVQPTTTEPTKANANMAHHYHGAEYHQGRPSEIAGQVEHGVVLHSHGLLPHLPAGCTRSSTDISDSSTSQPEHMVQIPQLSPCSLRAGQVTGGVLAVDTGSSCSEVIRQGGHEEQVFEDVIGELCATLEAPVTTTTTTTTLVTQNTAPHITRGGLDLKGTSLAEMQRNHTEHASLLDDNLPAVNLNDPDHNMMPLLDFDPSLFGDSPIKDSVF